MFQKYGLVLLVVLASITTVFPQNKVKELKIAGGCNYYGESFDLDVYTFESDQEAIDAVDNIINPIGLFRNFDIRAADVVPNAAAVVLPGDSTRYILYNQAFMRRVKNDTKTDWAAISIMAHEIGHHLNGHTLIAGGSRPKLELEADSFSGFALYKMGATLEEAQAAMNAIASETGSATHPAKRSRLAAIEAGWTKARDQDKTAARKPTEPRTPPIKTNSSTKLKLGTYKIVATQTGEFNGIPLTETITLKIKIESVDANGDVKARLYKSGGEGRLKGRVESNGLLQLEGFYVSGLNNEWNFKMKATVEDDTLINGKFLDVTRYVEVKGTFNIGTLQEEFKF